MQNVRVIEEIKNVYFHNIGSKESHSENDIKLSPKN